MPGSGAAPDGSGRRLITVKIDNSLASSGVTNANVWNAVEGCESCTTGALKRWNDAKDGSANTTGYYFLTKSCRTQTLM